MAVLQLQLLGGFKALNDTGQEIAILARKGRALLAILALSPLGGISRERLATLLWSDRGEDQARSSLRQTLTVLRKELAAVGPSVLVADDQRVELARDAVEIDAVSIVSLSHATDVLSLRCAVNLYQGELLAEVSVNDPAFEEWLASERSRMRNLMTTVFDRLLPLETTVERIVLAKRLVALDPLREASNLALMNAYSDVGERAMALQHYSMFKETLKSELKVQPSQEIEQLRLRLTSDGPAILTTSLSASTNPISENRDAKFQAKPSIVILTFANLSDDPTQRYFSDGITADIVTELSRFHQLQVHTEHHAAAGERPIVDAVATGRELGVQYVVEGSVRRLAQRLRINVQLVDVDTGEQLWSERFDTNEEEIFAVQDRIVRSITAQLSGRLRLAGLEKASRKPPSSMAAYDYVLRGDALPVGVPEAEAEARRLFQKAIDLDPGYARAYAHLSEFPTFEWRRNFDAPATLLDQSLELAKRAVSLDERDEFCHSMLGFIHMYRRSHELAEYHNLKALALNPNHPGLVAALGVLYGYRGEVERGLAYFREALVIDPHFGPTWYWRCCAVVYFVAHEYDEAIVAFNRSPIMPDWVEAYLAATYTQLGRMDEARQHAAAALQLSPNLSVHAFMSKEPYRRREDANHLADALRKAGFGE